MITPPWSACSLNRPTGLERLTSGSTAITSAPLVPVLLVPITAQQSLGAGAGGRGEPRSASKASVGAIDQPTISGDNRELHVGRDREPSVGRQPSEGKSTSAAGRHAL